MCSHSMKRMDNYQGDLTDILRATGRTIGGGATTAPEATTAVPDWQFPSNPISYTSDPAENFGHPFAHLRDPLLHDIDTPISRFFHNSDIIKEETVTIGGFATAGGNNNGTINLPHKNILDHDEIRRPSNIFSRMLQISPNAKLPLPQCDSPAAAAVAAAVASPRGTLKGPSSMLVSHDHHTLISPNSSKSCFVESPSLQISSPRNTGIKRRKSQAKKVVCIPAPAPANSRSTGEIVPSDLWAWRKYGQKPIKGSPYPRGYYRCSSSKGCSARKQVERSRTDPNMLVITYTSEHNHPWPTQRNALAGSTRSQPSKNNNTANKNSSNSEAQILKEEQKEISTENTAPSINDAGHGAVKDENMDHDMDDPELNKGFSQSYKPTLPDPNHSEDNFFAGLGEIEADSFDMLLTHGFSGDDCREDESLDPFSFYDWAGNSSSSTSAATSTTGATTSYGEAKKES
ncbi:hypothetical protein BUALT_Bualt03G0014000 [Buddleja alternifolia]|uniref:WRKY domain-containing protein n=1 Tax=Buddleja alternifolia TaxID=168488 RepID=A0AAV6XQD2_9LAMI|nr:hypothetical protein BUALT_Bualt03G0014000 [Buddleja alternifolia]